MAKTAEEKKAYNATQREKRRAYNAKYGPAHRARINANRLLREKGITPEQHAQEQRRREVRRKYQAARKEKLREEYRAYKKANKEGLKAKRRAYDAAHREEIRERDRAYRAKHKEKLGRRDQTYKLRKKCGITQDDKERMVQAQDGKCAICQREPIGPDYRMGSLHVDHDHTTGEVRALLCSWCNTALGLLRDDVTIAQSLIEYLKKYNGIRACRLVGVCA